jgi:hypothetical protein
MNSTGWPRAGSCDVVLIQVESWGWTSDISRILNRAVAAGRVWIALPDPSLVFP